MDESSIIEFEEEIKEEDITESIKKLANWKTPGTDQIYNFYIKKIHVLHNILTILIINTINGKEKLHKELTKGRTFLIPKEIPENKIRKGSDYRPITCLNTLYKLLTKVISNKITISLRCNEYLTDNQLGVKIRSRWSS